MRVKSTVAPLTNLNILWCCLIATFHNTTLPLPLSLRPIPTNPNVSLQLSGQCGQIIDPPCLSYVYVSDSKLESVGRTLSANKPHVVFPVLTSQSRRILTHATHDQVTGTCNFSRWSCGHHHVRAHLWRPEAFHAPAHAHALDGLWFAPRFQS